MGVSPGVVTDSETTPTPARLAATSAQHSRSASHQALGLDVRLAPVVDVRCVGAPRLASLLEAGAEDADLERARPDVDGEDVAAHGRRPSATRSACSACDLGRLQGEQGAPRDAAPEAGEGHGRLDAGHPVSSRRWPR